LFEHEFCQFNGWGEEGQLLAPRYPFISRSLSFHFWGYLKDKVYSYKINMWV